MPGDLKIILIVPMKNAEDIATLEAKINQFIQQNPDYRIDRITWDEVAKRPTEEMIATLLMEISKKLDELKLAQMDHD